MNNNDVKLLGNIFGSHFGTSYAENVWDKNYICPTLMTMAGGCRQPIIVEEDYNGKCSKTIRVHG